MDVEEAVKIKNQDIAQHLKLPPVKLHCSMLAEDAIQAAIKDFKTKKASAWSGRNDEYATTFWTENELFNLV